MKMCGMDLHGNNVMFVELFSIKKRNTANKLN